MTDAELAPVPVWVRAVCLVLARIGMGEMPAGVAGRTAGSQIDRTYTLQP